MGGVFQQLFFWKGNCKIYYCTVVVKNSHKKRMVVERSKNFENIDVLRSLPLVGFEAMLTKEKEALQNFWSGFSYALKSFRSKI